MKDVIHPEDEKRLSHMNKEFTAEQRFWSRIWTIVGVTLITGFISASFIATKIADSQYEQTKLLAPYIAKAYADRVKRGDYGL